MRRQGLNYINVMHETLLWIKFFKPVYIHKLIIIAIPPPNEDKELLCVGGEMAWVHTRHVTGCSSIYNHTMRDSQKYIETTMVIQ